MAGRRKKSEVVMTQEFPVGDDLVSSEAEPQRTVVTGTFNSVESNIKGGVRVELSPCTAIVSQRNRAGKTAVLDSFRFALTGTHPIGPHAVDLAGLTKDGSLPHAALYGESGNALASFPKGKKTVNHHVEGVLGQLSDEQRKALLPLSASRDLLTLGSAKAREELFRRFGDADVKNPKPRGLDAQQEALFQRAYNSTAGDVVERLAAAGTWLRSHKRLLGERLKMLEEEKSRLVDDATAEGAATDDVVEALEAKLRAWEAYRMGATLRSHVDGLSATLNAMIDQFTALSPPISGEEFQRQLENLPELAVRQNETDKLLRMQDKLDADSGKLKLLEAILTLRKALDGRACYVCATEFHGDVGALVHGAEAAIQKEASTLAGLKAEITEQKARVSKADHEWEQVATTTRNQWQRAVREYEQAKQRVQDMAATFKREQEKAAAAGAVVDAPDESEESIKSRLDSLKLAQAHGDRADKVAEDIRAVKDEQGDCKAVEAVLEHLLTKLLEGVQTKAEAAVNAWMPSGFRASLCLESDDGKPECRWEVVGTDGQPHRKGALSGAEWAALSVAIACAWTEGQPYRYLLLDDADIAGFNPENLRSTLSVVSKAVAEGRLTQALVAWSRPQEIPSEGWSVVEL